MTIWIVKNSILFAKNQELSPYTCKYFDCQLWLVEFNQFFSDFIYEIERFSVERNELSFYSLFKSKKNCVNTKPKLQFI